jgi:hypothetical protein
MAAQAQRMHVIAGVGEVGHEMLLPHPCTNKDAVNEKQIEGARFTATFRVKNFE